MFVENRNGASDNLATQAVVEAAPDGYTLLMASVDNAINAAFFDELSLISFATSRRSRALFVFRGARGASPPFRRRPLRS